MNERIRELADKAFVTVSSDGYFSSGKFCEKFAELIVRECANRATWAQDTSAADIGGEVLKHFGVAE
jgi:peroxiredoxin